MEELSSSDVIGMLTGSDEDLTPWQHWWPRVSRPCFDKFHRCPGWAGGGTRYAKVRRCDDGHIRYYDDDGHHRLWQWRCFRCPKCRVIVLPYLIRWLDWRYVWYWKLCRIPGDVNSWWRDEFSWWDEETSDWAGWAGPLSIIRRLPNALYRTLRYRIRHFMIMHRIRSGK